MSYLKDLERCGLATSNTLRELLTTCQDPVDAIRNFQEANAVQLPSLKPHMKLLDLHGVRRSTYHEAVIGELTEQILLKIRSLGEKPVTAERIRKLEQQLERSFKLYRVPRVRPIVLETLRQLPSVADRYLKLIVCDRELYESCAVEVKQQIWLKNDKMFLEAVEPLLASYLNERQLLLMDAGKVSGAPNFFTADTTRSRRQWRQVQELLTMCGEREALYTYAVDLIRERFATTANPHYCSLRLELLMAGHDANVECIVRMDPCHEFAWCLDACMRDRHMDAQQASKLKALMEPGSAQAASRTATAGDMAMIVADPHVTHFLASMAVKVLRDNASAAQHLPRDHLPLQLIVKLIETGARARELLSEEVELNEILRQGMLTRFLPAFSTMITQDMMQWEMRRVADELQHEFQLDELSVREVPEVVEEWLRESEVAALLWTHYVTDCLLPTTMTKKKHHRRDVFLRYFQLLPELAGNLVARDLWSHFVIHRLIQSSSLDSILADELMGRTMVQDLLLDSIDSSEGHSVHHINFQLLRLLVNAKESIPADLRTRMQEHLASSYTRVIEAADEEGDQLANRHFVAQFEEHRGLIDVVPVMGAPKYEGELEEGEYY